MKLQRFSVKPSQDEEEEDGIAELNKASKSSEMCALGMIQSEENSEYRREPLRNREVDFHLSGTQNMQHPGSMLNTDT